MAICRKCGSEIAEGATACLCGAPVQDVAAGPAEDSMAFSETLFMSSQERIAEGVPDDIPDPNAKTEEKVLTNDIVDDAQPAVTNAAQSLSLIHI